MSLTYQAIEIANYAQGISHPLLVVTNNRQEVYELETALQFFSNGELPVYTFPDYETLPYDHFSPHEDIISERIRTLYQLPALKRGVILVSIPTLMHRLPPLEFIQGNTFLLY